MTKFIEINGKTFRIEREKNVVEYVYEVMEIAESGSGFYLGHFQSMRDAIDACIKES